MKQWNFFWSSNKFLHMAVHGFRTIVLGMRWGVIAHICQTGVDWLYHFRCFLRFDQSAVFYLDGFHLIKESFWNKLPSNSSGSRHRSLFVLCNDSVSMQKGTVWYAARPPYKPITSSYFQFNDNYRNTSCGYVQEFLIHYIWAEKMSSSERLYGSRIIQGRSRVFI